MPWHWPYQFFEIIEIFLNVPTPMIEKGDNTRLQINIIGQILIVFTNKVQ